MKEVVSFMIGYSIPVRGRFSILFFCAIWTPLYSLFPVLVVYTGLLALAAL
jgi:hypothetical protein